MNIEFYFDPVCPWCWITSRWIKTVQPERDITITWKSISLLIKNGTDNPYGEFFKMTAQMLDVIEAVRNDGFGDKIDALYTAYGTSVHRDNSLRQEDVSVEEIIRAGLTSVGLDASYAEHAGSDESRSQVNKSTEEALALAGTDVGTPIIAAENSDGEMTGLFGPVISELPQDLEGSLKLWDAYVTLLDYPYFWELKRTRTQEANTLSTFTTSK